MITPVWEGHKRHAVAVAAAWPVAPRAARRAGARRYWRDHQRPAASWRDFWREINAAHGVVAY